MKYYLIIIGLLLLQASSYAQHKDSLYGKWKFHDFYKAPNSDSASLQLAHKMFGDLSLYLANDQHYKMTLMQTEEEGSWQWNESKQAIVLNSDKGSVNEVQVVSYKDQTLTITMGKPGFILKRTAVSEQDLVQSKKPEIKTVASSKAQISRKWYFTRREVPGKSEAEIQRISEIAAGTYYDFRSDGSFTAEVLGISAEGKWELGPGNTTIVLTMEDDKRIWNIQRVTDTELELVKGNTQQVWKFSAKEK